MRGFIKKHNVKVSDSFLPTLETEVIGEDILRTDPELNLKIRGPVLTDEGSFRDDFSTSLSSDWTYAATNNGSQSQSTTIQTIASGTSAGNIKIYRSGDYCPIIFKGLISVSQRIANQTISFGFRNDIDSPTQYAEFELTGTTNTVVTVKTQSSSSSGNNESFSHTIPNGKNTSQYLLYEIHSTQDSVSFYIDGILIRVCKIHVPDAFEEMLIFTKCINSATVLSTNILLDFISFNNQNQIEVKTDFNSQPLAIQAFGDQHHISAQLTTTATTADQTILTYTIPTNRTMKILGYFIETNNNGGTVKIGKNTIAAPTAGGEVDANLFRQLKFQNASNILDSFRHIDLSAFPRIIGSNGDIFKVLVTPNGTQSTLWTVTIDFILI